MSELNVNDPQQSTLSIITIFSWAKPPQNSDHLEWFFVPCNVNGLPRCHTSGIIRQLPARHVAWGLYSIQAIWRVANCTSCIVDYGGGGTSQLITRCLCFLNNYAFFAGPIVWYHVIGARYLTMRVINRLSPLSTHSGSLLLIIHLQG